MLADVGHIVVVDDDPSLRQMVIRYLEDHNIPTKPASNRTELNRHLTGTIPSLIILDLRLGQDDGLDMLREIRSHSDVRSSSRPAIAPTKSTASSASNSVRTTTSSSRSASGNCLPGSVRS